jgi:hypothetical protein
LHDVRYYCNWNNGTQNKRKSFIRLIRKNLILKLKDQFGDI